MFYVDKNKFRECIKIYQKKKKNNPDYDFSNDKHFLYIYRSLEKIILGYVNKYKFYKFSNIEDMKRTALIECIYMLDKFDLEKTSNSEQDKKVNPFNFFQTIIRNQILNNTKKFTQYTNKHLFFDFNEKKYVNLTQNDELFFYNESFKEKEYEDKSENAEFFLMLEEIIKFLKKNEDSFKDTALNNYLFNKLINFIESYKSFSLKIFIEFCKEDEYLKNKPKKIIIDFYKNVFLERIDILKLKKLVL